MHFVTCPKQGREIEAAVRHRAEFLAYSWPKQGQDFQPLAAPLYPNMGQVPPRRDHGTDHLIHGPAKFSFPVKSAMETCAKYQKMIKPVQELNYGNTNVLL